MKDQSYLQLLIGKPVTGAKYNTSTVAPINNDKNDSSLIRTSIFVQIYFEDYRLNIYNTIRISPSDKVVDNFVGLKVLEAYETGDEAVLVFSDGYKIVIDLRDEAYSDPEAMYLTGPDNFWVVWN